MPQLIEGRPWDPILNVPGGDVPSVHGRAPTPGNQWYGPFKYGGSWYSVVEVGQPSNNYWDTWFLKVMKATDDTLVDWNEVDAADHPTGHEVNVGVYYPGTGATIYFAYKRRISSTVGDYDTTLVTFDMSTEQWGTPITGGPDPGGGFTGCYLTIRSNGDYVILMSTGSGPDGTDFPTLGVHYVIYDVSGASWGSPVLVSPDSANYKAQQIQLDSSDLVHFYYAIFGVPNSTYYHRSLDSGDSLGTEQTLFTSTDFHGIGVPTYYADKIYVPYVDNTATVFYPYVAVGDAKGDADPTWASTQISSTVAAMDPVNPDNACTFAVINTDGDLVVFWVTPIPNTAMGVPNYLMFSVYDGSTWTDPAIFVEDEATNAYQDWWHNPSVTLDTDTGNLRMVIDRIHRTKDNNAWSINGAIISETVAAVSGFPYTW